MDRRQFLTALLGAAVAAPMLSALDLTPAPAPTWLAEAATLQRGDIFTIEGVFAVNPLSYRPMMHLQQFVVVSVDEADPQIAPQMITSGEYQTVSNLPWNSAHIYPLRTGEYVCG